MKHLKDFKGYWDILEEMETVKETQEPTSKTDQPEICEQPLKHYSRALSKSILLDEL